MRLPALTMNNLMRQNQGGPPAPGPPSLPSSSHLNDMHMRGPPPPLQAPPRMDMSMNRPSPGGPPSWPSSRPQIESEPLAMKRPNSPPRERNMPYQQAPGPQLSVQAPRDDYDYPTYQPPEALVGQRIAKTFAGHGRFVGQVRGPFLYLEIWISRRRISPRSSNSTRRPSSLQSCTPMVTRKSSRAKTR